MPTKIGKYDLITTDKDTARVLSNMGFMLIYEREDVEGKMVWRYAMPSHIDTIPEGKYSICPAESGMKMQF